MKLLRLLIVVILSFSAFFNSVQSAQAVAVAPFPPFSQEGNPPEDYFFELFKLFRYIRPRALEIYENADRSRTYVDLQICPGKEADRRDYYCNNQGDGCDGGEVDLCHNDPGNQSFAMTVTSKDGSCKLDKARTEDPNELIEGKCEYKKKPTVVTKVQGTDFSVNDTLAFPKIQSETLAYSNIGTDNNISWGSLYLSSDSCEINIRKVLVLRRASHTKLTLRETGEWPLGWVDWGYKDKNMTKTLLEIDKELPDSVASHLNPLVQGIDSFYITAGNLEKTYDVSADKKAICKAIDEARAKTPDAEWLKDLDSVPMYSPSFRQGYVRPSICVWDKCCPTLRCPLNEDELLGAKRGLYYDTSVSQAFGAALDDLFITYPLDQSKKIFTELVTQNPLIRYLTSAEPVATPSRIRAELDKELKDTCLKYIPWGNWLAFGTHMDYLDSGNFLGPNKTCPDYELMPELTKERGAAKASSLLDAIVNLIWGRKVDDVEPVKYHLLTIPDAMGQSLSDIKQFTYDTRDTAQELSGLKDYNLGLSNNVEDGKDLLYGGKQLGPVDAKRHLAYYTCNDEMFSSQQDTSIEAYALGTRIGCNQAGSAPPEGKCDGQLFAKLLSSSNYQDVGAKGEAYFNSYIKGNLTPELMNTYAAAEKATGVPCEILAGIHFVEADNNPKGSLVSGRTLGTPEPDAGGKVFHSLLDTAIYAGKELKGKVGSNLASANVAITALSRYNGGGNSNCQLGYPYKIPYGGCPRLFEGEDDPYPTSFLDAKHNSMYLLYCADRTACVPQVFERPGSFAVALAVYNGITKNGYQNETLPKTPQKTPSPKASPTTGSGSSGFFPKSCSAGTLSTALGCIPYTAKGFASALLSALVGVAGAIALITMLIATFQIMTAGGDAKKLSKGKELFGSAIMGLLFLIFSVTLLRIIAGDIIKLPGF